MLIALTNSLLLPESGILSGETFALMAGTLIAGTVCVCILTLDDKRTAFVPAAIIGGAVGGLFPAVPRLLGGEGLLVSVTAFGLFFVGAIIALVLSMGLTFTQFIFTHYAKIGNSRCHTLWNIIVTQI